MGRRHNGEKSKSKSSSSSSNSSSSSLGLPSGVGFGGYVGTRALVNHTTTNPLLLLLDHIDAELPQIFKKLSRKDPTTKLKALTTLSTLLKNKSAKEELSLIMPQWVFEYKKLLQDYNREVRRATHDTMATVVSTIGRDLAPHLKSLMGPWWLSQFDLFHDVSQAAKRSLQAAFPAQEKRLDALMLCTDEVFMYLEDNLKLTPQSMSDKAVALDELELMHQQVISTSLLALASLIDILINEKHGLENLGSERKHTLKARSTAISHAEKLLSVHRCADFLKSHSCAIRSATYSLVGSCVKNIPHALNEANIKTLAPVILRAFQEEVPTCHSSMWEAVLMFFRKFPESWTTMNVDKTFLGRFWNFLRNGCFGSQQVSYPALVVFLDCIPPMVTAMDKFFLDFFQNFWAGKIYSQSSNADQLAFFQSYRACFMWVLRNAQRYCDGVEAMHRLQHTIVDAVLLKLMWHDYLLVPSSENKMKSLDSKYQVGHVQEFGKCITEILSGIYSLKPNLLSVFCLTFEENCLDAFQLSDNIESCENVDKIIRFLLLVDLHAVREGDSWPLSYLVGPVLSKSFQLIQTIDSSNPVKFMVAAVSTFGPRKFIQKIMHEQNESSSRSEEKNRNLSLKQFLQHFNENFVSWCLQTDSYPTSARLNLLFALLDDECFPEQCNSIILHAASTQDSNYTCRLALVMEKTRGDCIKKKLHLDLSHHELLGSTALSVTRSFPPFGSSDARFVCAALGGKTEEDPTCLLSENTSTIIYEELFQKLRSFIGTSIFTWVKDANKELSKAKEHLTIKGCESSSSLLEMANFAMEVLNGSFFRLINLAKNSTLLAHVLSALFVIDWEYSTSAVFYEGLDIEAYSEAMDRYNFCKSVHTFRRKINKFLKTVGPDCRSTLGRTLVQAIRCVVFNEDKLDIDKVTSLGCLFFLDVMDNLCQGQVEEQTLMDELLNNSGSWPVWVTFDVKDGQRSATLKTEFNSSDASENYRVATFVEKLMLKVGLARVIAGSISSEDSMACHLDYPRAWLASEMLCTWKWQGGSALTSFLPSLIQYTKNQKAFFPSSDNLLDSIVNILIDGAIIQGADSKMSCSSIYPASYDELEQVFLRALLLILHTLFEDNIWGRSKALSIFNLLVDRLFVGEVLNSNCLKILVVVMSFLIEPLFGDDEITDSSEQKELLDVIEAWLLKTLTFPPLNTWLSAEDMEDWFQLVVSCYPLRGRRQFRPQRYISHVERGLLLELLRKQWLGSASATVNKLPIVQMLMSKLTVVVVGYCWSDFNQDDWDFVFFKSRYWIESTVVLMEEVAWSVNEIITSCPTSDILESLQRTVLGLDCTSFNVATNALMVFSMFCMLIGQNTDKNEKENDQNPLRPEKWDLTKDKILQGILRLLFATGAAEAIAGSYSSVIASSRLSVCYFWELVASSAVESSSHVRDCAIKSFDSWSLSRGAVGSLYAILFSSKPVLYLQYAAYVILSSDSVADLAFVTQETSSLNKKDIVDKDPLDSSLETKIQLREEISIFLEKSIYEIIDLDLVAPDRVHVFVAWSLIISHLVSSSSSPTTEKLIQHIRYTSSSSIILDCIFQHIPLELCAASVKKKMAQLLPACISEATSRAITDNSVLFALESLWPVGPDGMASFAGAIYGLMLRTFPAKVRDWFNNIRDRTSSSAIEVFTRTYCSPHLITNELCQIKKANLCDENFSVSVSRSANEVVATYTKEESNMNLVVRLPPSYALRPVDVECTRSFGISEVKRKAWLHSIISFVANQNGGLAEAIRLWKNNFDKEFEGVEECPICYSLIHTSSRSRPKRDCRTCKHKFHSACLYKWFLTCSKDSCPLCRSLF